ncbi:MULTISPECIES: RNA polymerase sigma factor FliA [Larsenimonas]|uniref:RNA polymerase sigma factor FliA n=1 Tax=Larsenimonas suaedae TaxID=1851019 RepID=A0ABU1GXX7_9GAMM|nr:MULTISPECIES: RNA polymerase sigma factor FliA [Larsenimonas]MCM2971597.1 RNA polymerase sigma factor FliA [Larsenimonas suaedae]MCM5703704.1 RNA polymerase sigma factor FliA [Larsenimonas salina]MDR5896853.1 RNA polymerase sigma factor FliA [Larsenimonas suaedae]
MYTAEGKLNPSNLVDQYMPLVRRQALQLQVRLPASVELDDLIQAGMVGLLDAYNRFDSGQGATFSTYASQRIRGAMIDELRSRDWLPRSVRRTSRDIDRAIHKLEQENARPATEREISEELGITLEEYRKVLNDTNNGYLLPFEDTSSDESEASHVSSDVASMATPQESFFAFADRQQLASAIDNLPEREKLLLGLYYQEELNLKEIGSILGVSESRVCQLHSQAVSRLRASMVNEPA